METMELVWQGALRKDMVPNWTQAQIDELIVALDEAVNTVVDRYWGYHAILDPVVRDSLINIVGLDSATTMMEESQSD